ncbi:hypothetical protein HPP92_022511 [Vanilla planifolia]|uniref:Uncharacterized protein n=1 Tax=Vanilla planifolia TaxID=51239 RepID=A0A835PPT6_VANPL|nr:hypothetical protein HPP92_022511 [Vanilla planifolia]
MVRGRRRIRAAIRRQRKQGERLQGSGIMQNGKQGKQEDERSQGVSYQSVYDGSGKEEECLCLGGLHLIALCSLFANGEAEIKARKLPTSEGKTRGEISTLMTTQCWKTISIKKEAINTKADRQMAVLRR